MSRVLKNVIIEEFELPESNSYWHCTIMDLEKFPVASGFGSNREVARGIANSEYIERDFFSKIKTSDKQVRNQWGLDLIETACGFAAGTTLRNTILRSIGEALERWTMSQWIDNQFRMDCVALSDAGIGKELQWIVKQFEDIKLYEKDLVIQYGDVFIKYKIGFSIAMSANGVFPGSGYFQSELNNKMWEHCLIESLRHKLVYLNTKPTNLFPDNKVRFFAENKNIALERIEKSTKLEWPAPKIILHEWTELSDSDAYVCRTIVDGWVSWNKGPIDRFLY